MIICRVPGLHLRDYCWACLKGHQRRFEATFNNTRHSPLTCQVMVLDWCGPHHATGLGSLYWFLSVGPDTSYHLAGIENEKSANPVLLVQMLQQVADTLAMIVFKF